MQFNQLPINIHNRKRALVAERQLQNLVTYTQAFVDAFNLSEFCKKKIDVYFYWRLVAGRDGAMSLYHFQQSLKTVCKVI